MRCAVRQPNKLFGENKNEKKNENKIQDSTAQSAHWQLERRQ